MRCVGKRGVFNPSRAGVREGRNASVSRVEYPVLGDRTLWRIVAGTGYFGRVAGDTRVVCDASAEARTR